MPATFYADNLIGEFLFRGGALTPPGTWYMALFTTMPTQNGGGTEVSGSSYARQAVAWDAFSGGISPSSADADFGTAGEDWGTVKGAGLYDAMTSGNLWVYDPLDNSVTINEGDSFKFAAGKAEVQQS